MKNSPLIAILVGILAISALVSVLLCGFYIHNTGELRNLQGTANFINGRQTAIVNLANDLVEYSKKNPQIDPVLESVGIKAKPGAAGTK